MKKREVATTSKADGNGNGHNNGQAPAFHFDAIAHSDVPHGRNGKHRTIVANILEDLGNRSGQQAVRVPLRSLRGEKIQNLRSALNRASRQKGLSIATASDQKYFYVWNARAGNSGGPDSERSPD